MTYQDIDHVHVLEYIYEATEYGERPVGKFCPECQLVLTMGDSISYPKTQTSVGTIRVNWSHLRRKRALGLF